ncbi:uncharacterized protein LOC112687281 [Sipha flava]|uniref:Uncharacterized protein LOC112687281 n=1 Tax=Sipha flava TaxID=143950 RepID=A0A8B8FY23_9HEMI|nr:uncharacterized protein LOC112687281 [Sipha flava]XP_025415692.1 uncharacterized protein LOC112687281 [Sipha flava]XP_025415693.1 uncharacterized protein LOC112687281 [Sipha flava]
MDNRSKKLPKFGTSKVMFTPNLGYKRIVAKDSDPQVKVEVKLEHDSNSSAESSSQKQKKIKERSTTQIQSVFSNMSSTGQGKSGSSRMGLSSGFRSYSNQGSFNSSGSFVKNACQSIQQMQNMMDENQFDVDDPMDDLNRPVRLPFIKKDRMTQIKTENSLEYPFQKNIYPSLSELMAPESLTILQFYDSSFSIQQKITDISLTENDNNDTPDETETETKVPLIKTEYNSHIKVENDSERIHSSQPIGKIQYYRSGRVVLIFNGKEYELLKANEDKHHKELFSLTKVEAERPDKLVSLGTIPVRFKAVLDIKSIINNFLKNTN